MSIKWIADCCSNHNQDLSRIEKLIITAKEIGCYAVKFQLFRGDKLYAPEFPEKIKEAQAQELPIEFIPKIFAMCHAHKIEFHCTPFDLEAVEILKPYVNQFKIGSYEILNLKLIEACLQTGKPLGIAFGNYDNNRQIYDILEFLAKFPEIELLKFHAAQGSLESNNNPQGYLTRKELYNNITIYHCISEYPAKAIECDFKSKGFFLYTAAKRSKVKFGWSDHTVQPGVIFAAVACGLNFIEFHLDLEDGQGFEYKYGHCWKPSQIESTIKNVRIMESALNKPIQEKLSSDIHKWRSDPEDGMRPLKEFRKELSQKEFLKDITD